MLMSMHKIAVVIYLTLPLALVCVCGMPLIQISQDALNDDNGPQTREEVHLEDFFWTGSGDGPPEYLKNVHTGISKGKDIVVKTETVVATVYVDGNNEIDIPICLDCPPDDGGGGSSWNVGGDTLTPLNYSITDRRYWLLTVMSGFYTQKDNPILEEKLARLYRLAFTRQQSKHLGINGANQISGLLIPTVRDRRAHNITKELEPIDPDGEVEMLNLTFSQDGDHTKTIARHLPSFSEWSSSSEELEKSMHSTEQYPTETTTSTQIDAVNSDKNESNFAVVTLVPWEFIQNEGKSEKQLARPVITDQPRPKYQDALTLQQSLLPRGNVRVMIHNVTQITESDVQKGAVSTTYDDEVNDKIEDRPVANQTELIYSVFVNGRPVLAVSAANDMKLVSATEVSEAIGHEIIMKAEPYLREPQATPLAPATRSGTFGVIDSIQNNTALVVVSSIAILLLLLLLVILLLVGHSRGRDKNAELNRATSNEGISGNLIGQPTSINTTMDSGRTTVQSRDVGIQNFSFENEAEMGHSRSRVARIHFPGPPHSESRRGSLTSSDNTSDSSVYCPINPPTADVQRMLDHKAASLFDRHNRRHHHQHQYDRAEGHEDAVYTKVTSDKKRYKTKRRYLSENRVGSLETSPTQRSINNSSGDEVITGSIDDGEAPRRYENLETNEAFNPHSAYHRNKLYEQHLTKNKKYVNAPDKQLHTPEAINSEIIRNLQSSARSSDTGSIGSFLSMASVKAFPKGTMPEPLNRVLDPVFVTYYDNVDNNAAHASSGKSHKSEHRNRNKERERRDSFNSTTIATIENFPSPRAPPTTASALRRLASQSDNPDPGVVGPIVWERHKKQLNKDDNTKTANKSINNNNNNDDDDGVDDDDCDLIDDYAQIQDPAAMRHHYEGLLEGAIQMYSSQDDLPMPLPIGNFTNKRKPTKREYRGSSAGGLSLSNKRQWKNIDSEQQRPSTAQPEKTIQSNPSTLPPTPTSGAWGGGSSCDSNATMLRPMSAGPFHHPSEPDMSIRSSSSRIDLSAAPLIEAIQTELRKFKKDQI